MEEQKLRQVEYHEREHYRALDPRTADNTHPYVAWLNNYRLRKAAEMMRDSVAGKTVLSICGGDGQEADFFQRRGASVTVIDLSTIALRAARLRNPSLQCACMDAEELTFPSASFDWVIVRDGLHHLGRPLKGLYEAERVCRLGFVILEGQDSLPVRFGDRLILCFFQLWLVGAEKMLLLRWHVRHGPHVSPPQNAVILAACSGSTALGLCQSTFRSIGGL
jgi:SAM-dependent methyltransferase